MRSPIPLPRATVAPVAPESQVVPDIRPGDLVRTLSGHIGRVVALEAYPCTCRPFGVWLIAFRVPWARWLWRNVYERVPAHLLEPVSRVQLVQA